MKPPDLFKGPLAWAAIFAVLLLVSGWLIWDLSSYLTEQRVRSEQSAQDHAQYAEDRIDRECLSLHGPALRNCIHEQISAAKDHERANQDLNAQKEMALFTRVMGIAAVAGFILGLVSIYVIYRTLREMGDANRIMRESTQAEIGAYVSVNGITFTGNHIPKGFAVAKSDGVDLRQGYASIAAHISVENKGQSAAKNVQCWVEYRILKMSNDGPGSRIGSDVIETNQKVIPVRYGILAKGERIVNEPAVTITFVKPKNTEKFDKKIEFEKEDSIDAIVQTSYEDVFGNQWKGRSEFSFRNFHGIERMDFQRSLRSNDVWEKVEAKDQSHQRLNHLPTPAPLGALGAFDT